MAALFTLALCRTRISRRVHLLLLAVIANRLLIQFESILDANGIVENYPYLHGFGLPFKLLAPCLFYFFFRAAVEPRFTWSGKDLFHAIPFVLGGVLYWHSRPVSAAEITPEFVAQERYLRTWTWLVVAMPYLWTVHQRLKQARIRLMQSRSDLDHLHLNWLNLIMILAFLGTSLSIVDVVLGPEIQLWTLDSLLNAIGLFALIWTSLKTSILFTEDTLDETACALELPTHELEKLKALLQLKLNHEALYLKPALRLSDLAEAMEQKPYVVSQVIKQGYQSNFYELVNQLRIEHAKRKLRENEDNSKILAVALDSGFNSKSTFNDAFRRTVGMTPSEYKRSSRTDSHPN